MSQHEPHQPFPLADDIGEERTPVPSRADRLVVIESTLDEHSRTLERLESKVDALTPVVRKLRVESKALQLLKSGALVTLATAAGNILIAQLPGAKEWVPVIIKAITLTSGN
jgi:hypothetical protein